MPAPSDRCLRGVNRSLSQDDWGISGSCLCARPWCIATASPPEPLRTVSQLTIALWVLWTQAHLVSKLNVWGACDSDAVSTPDVGFKPFREKLGVVGFL